MLILILAMALADFDTVAFFAGNFAGVCVAFTGVLLLRVAATLAAGFFAVATINFPF